jgi:hypothetical protein
MAAWQLETECQSGKTKQNKTKHETLPEKQVAECLCSKSEALSSNPITAKNQKHLTKKYSNFQKRFANKGSISHKRKGILLLNNSTK